MAFKKGQGGRPKGAPNKVDGMVRARCLALIKDPAYQKEFKRRLLAGELAPALETMTWYYAGGKPPDSLEISGPDRGPIPYTWQD